jgi:hypothetical protein
VCSSDRHNLRTMCPSTSVASPWSSPSQAKRGSADRLGFTIGALSLYLVIGDGASAGRNAMESTYLPFLSR